MRRNPWNGTPVEETLSEQLTRHLYTELSGCPREQRRQAQWAMSADWYNEVRKLKGGQGLTDASLFGLPMVVREDAGVPKLEPVHA